MKRLFFITFLIFTSCLANLAQTDENSCPEVKFSIANEQAREDELAFFIADIGKEIESYEVEYHWEFYFPSYVKILEGQGKKIIKVLRKSTDVVNVTLKVKGLPETCSNTYTRILPAIDPPELIEVDRFEKASKDEIKIKVENFVNELRKDSTARGLVIVPENQNSIDQIKLINNALNVSKFDKTKIKFIVTAEQEIITQLFLVPNGAFAPKFKDGLVIKAEDFGKLEKLFLKNK